MLDDATTIDFVESSSSCDQSKRSFKDAGILDVVLLSIAKVESVSRQHSTDMALFALAVGFPFKKNFEAVAAVNTVQSANPAAVQLAAFVYQQPDLV